MTPKWQKLASLAQEICTLWFQFFSAVFAFKGHPFKSIFVMFVVDVTMPNGVYGISEAGYNADGDAAVCSFRLYNRSK